MPRPSGGERPAAWGTMQGYFHFKLSSFDGLPDGSIYPVPLRKRQEAQVLLLRPHRRDRENPPHDRGRSAPRRPAARRADSGETARAGVAAGPASDAATVARRTRSGGEDSYGVREGSSRQP